MQKYIERMLFEKKDLEVKIKKAEEATQNEPYGMTNEGKELLLKQLCAMKDYLHILEERIKYESEK